MPVTARLSRKFYEKLGEDIAQDFVDWFNMEARNAAARTDLIKWTFVFWATSALVVISIMTRLL